MKNRIKWSLETRNVSDLRPYDKNPRIITDDSLKELKKSFDDIGYAQPININTHNVILSGHARWMQLKKDGVDEVAVYVPDRELTPKQEEAVIIRMNKNIAGSWDFDKLANEFELDDLIEWGFDKDDFDVIDAQVVDLPDLGDGSDPDIQQCTFTLSNEQKDILDEAMEKAKSELDCTDEINQNSNGNKLSAIMRWYCGR